MFIFLSAFHLLPNEKKFLDNLFQSQSKRMWLLSVDILKNKEMAEDAVQSSFIKLIEKISLLMGFENEDKVNGYVYIVTKNMALSIIRKNKIHDHLNLADFEYILPDSKTNTEKTAILNDEMVYIQQKILCLKPIYREAIYLKYFLQLDYLEMADVLHITVENARVRVCTGLKNVRELEATERGDGND